MIRFNRFNKAKSAGVSLEMLLMIVLALGVLFLVLGIFNDNLKEMNSASGSNNLFNKTHATKYSTTSVDYTTSQVNVQIAGSQGLTTVIPKYKATAEAEIITLSNAFAQNGSLTVYQQYDLAKWLTLYGICAQNSGISARTAASYYISGTPSISAMAGFNGAYTISVDGTTKTTTLNGNVINWTSSVLDPNLYSNLTDANKIKIVNDIYNNAYFLPK